MQEYFDVLTSEGDYTNKIETREKCHEEGLWHKAVVLIILSTDNKRVLLQQRSANKKLWPNKWDISAGGHVLSGEFGYQSVIRETEEELGLKIEKDDLEFIGATTSENIQGKIVNRHFNEFYIVHKDVDIKDIKLQEEEVQDIKWIDREEVIRMINNNYENLTEKINCWNYLIKYFKMLKEEKIDKDFEMLLEKAKEITGKKELNKSIQYGHVGCALLTDKGNVYTGLCIVANCGIGFCAEHAAIAEMLKNNESRIIKIVATDKNGAVAPCGRCRELMKQINYENLNTKIMINNNQIVTLDKLLPHVWMP